MNIVAGEVDGKIQEEELRDFLPARIFDFHCHVVNSEYIPPGCLPPGMEKAGAGGSDELKKHNELLFPGIPVKSLLMGCPDKHADIEGQNNFLTAQIAGEDALYMLLLVSPGTKSGHLMAQLDRANAAGLKPYKCFRAWTRKIQE